MRNESAESAACSPDDRREGDPWHAFGYIVSGVGVYGVLGWLADRWLGTSFLVAVGILVGAGLGHLHDLRRFNKRACRRHGSPRAGPERSTQQD